MDEIIKANKTAYEIETELGGSGPNRTGFGGRPELINFYVEMKGGVLDVSSMPVLDSLTIDAMRCGKMIPVMTIAGKTPMTAIAVVMVSTTEVTFTVAIHSFVYTIETKTWATRN